MLARLGAKEGYSLVELVITVAAVGAISLVAASRFFGVQDQAKIDNVTATVDRQAAAIMTWAATQSEFDAKGQRLGALDVSQGESVVQENVAKAAREKESGWEVAGSASATPEPGKSMVWHDIANDGERLRITRCREGDPAERKICARMDIFPWGDSRAGERALSYRFIDCAPGSSSQCQASGKSAFWTTEQCQKWPAGGTVVKNPGGSGVACSSFSAASTDSCDTSPSAAEPCVVDDRELYTTSVDTSLSYPLVLTVTDGGYITSNDQNIDCPRLLTGCSANYSKTTEQTVTLTVHVNEGYAFAGWGGDANCGTATTCQIVMSKASTASARFVDKSTLSSNVSVPVILSGGESHTCAVNENRALYCWGENASGQLGDGTKTSRTSPVAVSGLGSGVQGVAAGANHSCAVQTSGGIKCWGSGAFGQLGSSGDSTAPKDVVLGQGVLAQSVAAGAYHTCAVVGGGTVLCWGRNNQGQLGNGSTINSTTPVSVTGINDASRVWAGQYYTCAKTTVSVKCWGDGTQGQLGNSSTSDSSTPVTVSLLPGGVSMGYFGSHSCTPNSAGAALCWGYNSNGQLGDGSTTTRLIPTGVTGVYSGITQTTGGSAHSCSLSEAGGVKCWGLSTDGQLGNGLSGATSSAAWSYVPVGASGGMDSGVSSVVAGAYHTCAATLTYQVKCWGRNSSGQLGDGTNSGQSTPVLVSLP